MEKMERTEKIDRLTGRLNNIKKVLFLWQLGLEYTRSGAAEDVAALFSILTEQLKHMEKELEELRAS